MWIIQEICTRSQKIIRGYDLCQFFNAITLPIFLAMNFYKYVQYIGSGPGRPNFGNAIKVQNLFIFKSFPGHT